MTRVGSIDPTSIPCSRPGGCRCMCSTANRGRCRHSTRRRAPRYFAASGAFFSAPTLLIVL